MIWAIKQLLAPCNYLRIKQGAKWNQSKRVYDLVLPTIGAALTIGLCWLLDIPQRLYGHSALSQSLSSLFALLIAFYMAALAAVATFERAGIDSPLEGEQATLRAWDEAGRQYLSKPLSYRQFIAYLFGYLSFLSLALFLSLMFFDTVWPKAVAKLCPLKPWLPQALLVVDHLTFAMFTFGFWQMFVTSALGIYFLADRMQTLPKPNP